MSSQLCNSKKPHPQQCSSSCTCTSEEVTVPSYLFTSWVFQEHSGVQRLRQGRVVSEILDEGLLTAPYPSTNVIFTALLSLPLAIMWLFCSAYSFVITQDHDVRLKDHINSVSWWLWQCQTLKKYLHGTTRRHLWIASNADRHLEIVEC